MESHKFLELVGIGSKKVSEALAIATVTGLLSPGKPQVCRGGRGKSAVLESTLSVSDSGENKYQSILRNQGINEKFVQCLWVDQLFRKGLLETAEGQKLEILSPGRWNLEGGPDFQFGKLKFWSDKSKASCEKIIVGDIEAHVLASSWKTHGHNKDKAYDRVILHVFLYRDNPGESALNSSGLEVPQLELLPLLSLPLPDLGKQIRQYEYPFKNPGSRGKCYEILLSLSSEKLEALLDHFGDIRFIDKSAGFSHLFPNIGREGNSQNAAQDREQLVYKLTMEAMGIRNNRLQFARLASLFDAVKVRKLLNSQPSRKRLNVLESTLVNLAGFLPVWTTMSELDRGSKLYLARLQRDISARDKNAKNEAAFYKSIAEMEAEGEHLGKEWQFRGMRPANYPVRRIAGMSHLLVNCLPAGIFAAVQKILKENDAFPAPVLAALIKLFKERSPSYWNYRYTFNGKKLPGSVALVGKDKMMVILINVILPLYFAQAWLNWDITLGRKIYLLWCRIPNQAMHNVHRYMQTRLLGNAHEKWKIIHSSRRQQALIHIYQSYCQSAEKSCQDCEFLMKIANFSR